MKNYQRVGRMKMSGAAAVLFSLLAGSSAIAADGGGTVQTAKGDWPQAGFDSAHSGFNRFEHTLTRSTVRHLTEIWKAEIGGGIFTSPVVGDGKVFIGGGDGHMYAFDAATGSSLWVGPQQKLFFIGSAATSHGLVFASSVYQTLVAYRAGTGAVAWTSDLTDVRASQTIADGRLYVASFDGTLSALDPKSGRVLWSTPAECCVYDQAPVVDGGRVFQMRTDDTLTAYDARTGTKLWSIPAFSVGTFSADRGKLFYSDYPNVVAVDEATGARLWTAPVITRADPTAPVVAKGRVFVTSSLLWALDEETGAVLWNAPAESNWGPTLANGVVYASNQSGEWDAFDATDGSLLWSTVIDGGCFFSCAEGVPVVADGILYLAGPDDFLHAYSFTR